VPVLTRTQSLTDCYRYYGTGSSTVYCRIGCRTNSTVLKCRYICSTPPTVTLTVDMPEVGGITGSTVHGTICRSGASRKYLLREPLYTYRYSLGYPVQRYSSQAIWVQYNEVLTGIFTPRDVTLWFLIKFGVNEPINNSTIYSMRLPVLPKDLEVDSTYSGIACTVQLRSAVNIWNATVKKD
jgi:hypothetical protein